MESGWRIRVNQKLRAGPRVLLPVGSGVLSEANVLGSTNQLRTSDRILLTHDLSLADDLSQEAAVAFFGTKVLLNLLETSRCKSNSRLSVR
jgi:hypothetical protein